MTRILVSISLLTLAAGCGSSTTTPAGAADTGAPDTGAPGPDGGSVGTTDAAPNDGASPGAAPIMKFCNSLFGAGSTSITLTLAIGNPPVSFTAASGQCDPPPPTACRTIQGGSAVSTVLLDSGGVQLAKGTLGFAPGTEYIFFSAIGASGNPTVQGGAVKAPYQCATIDPYPHDGGASD
jgi:hypothetical protein